MRAVFLSQGSRAHANTLSLTFVILPDFWRQFSVGLSQVSGVDSHPAPHRHIDTMSRQGPSLQEQLLTSSRAGDFNRCPERVAALLLRCANRAPATTRAVGRSDRPDCPLDLARRDLLPCSPIIQVASPQIRGSRQAVRRNGSTFALVHKERRERTRSEYPGASSELSGRPRRSNRAPRASYRVTARPGS